MLRSDQQDRCSGAGAGVASTPAAPAAAPAAAAAPAGSFPPHQVLSLPALSPTMSQGNISHWVKKVGEAVAPGDVLCEMETDKASISWESQDEGFLAHILVGDGAKDIPVSGSRADVCTSGSMQVPCRRHAGATPTCWLGICWCTKLGPVMLAEHGTGHNAASWLLVLDGQLYALFWPSLYGQARPCPTRVHMHTMAAHICCKMSPHNSSLTQHIGAPVSSP